MSRTNAALAFEVYMLAIRSPYFTLMSNETNTIEVWTSEKPKCTCTWLCMNPRSKASRAQQQTLPHTLLPPDTDLNVDKASLDAKPKSRFELIVLAKGLRKCQHMPDKQLGTTRGSTTGMSVSVFRAIAIAQRSYSYHQRYQLQLLATANTRTRASTRKKEAQEVE